MQVLLCLISNALNFTQEGEVQIEVEIVENTTEKKYLKISVTDTGVGIHKQDYGKLFKLFGFVSDSQDMNVNGIGLGLHIARQIVEKFEG